MVQPTSMTYSTPSNVTVQGIWPTKIEPAELGIVMVDHGSQRDDSNRYVLELVTRYQQQTKAPIVEPAHMELAQPDLAAAYDRCVQQGATYIIVHPYFLAPGRHWHKHIPELAQAAAAKHPDTACIVTPPLGIHPLMVDIVDDRIQQALKNR